jgi:hypothetical protein
MNTISSDIPREVEDIIIDIKYISGLPPGCKYDLESKSYVDANNLLSRGYRTFFTSERRVDAFDFINKTIIKAVDISSQHQAWSSVIAEEIHNMRNALVNLKHVYHRYPEAKGRIETIEIRIDRKAFKNACQQDDVNK